MTEYRKYSEYKDSGEEFLGEIPSSWDVVSVKKIATLKNGRDTNDGEKHKGEYPVYSSGGLFGNTNSYLAEGPSVMFGRKGTIDKPFLVESGKFWHVDTVFRSEINQKLVLPKMFFYMSLIINYNYLAAGAAVPSMTQTKIHKWKVALPPLKTQQKIVKFLDKETAHIDAGIANMESLTALLTEKRAALISETVTRGIPGEHTEFKDSGVDWLGEIPASWEIKAFRNCFKELSELNGENPVGKMVSVSGYRGVEYKEYSSEELRRDVAEVATYRVIRPGQLAVNTMWLNYGGLGVSEIEGHMSPAYRAYAISNILDKKFAHHLLRSSIYIQGYTGLLRGLRPNSLQMSRRDLMVFPVLVPSFEEQQKIGIFLETELPKIDAVIAEVEAAITLMKEKRQILISDVVTGKIDVSEGAN